MNLKIMNETELSNLKKEIEIEIEKRTYIKQHGLIIIKIELIDNNYYIELTDTANYNKKYEKAEDILRYLYQCEKELKSFSYHKDNRIQDICYFQNLYLNHFGFAIEIY